MSDIPCRSMTAAVTLPAHLDMHLGAEPDQSGAGIAAATTPPTTCECNT